MIVDQILPLVVVVVLIGAATLWHRRTNGVARAGTATFAPDELRRLGVSRGPVILLFTSPGCASCAGAKRVLDEVSSRLGLPVVVADVTEHPEVARAQHVYRAPTIFVVDERGRALSRITGVPQARELESALTPLMPAA